MVKLNWFKEEEQEKIPLFNQTDSLFPEITIPLPGEDTAKKLKKGSLWAESTKGLFLDDDQFRESIDREDSTFMETANDVLHDIVTQPLGGFVDASESLANLVLPKENEIEISDYIPEAKTTFGRFVRPASQFLIPYTGAYKVLRGGYLFVKNAKQLKKTLETGKKVLAVKKTKEGTTLITRQGAKIKPTKTESLVQAARKTIGKDDIIKPKFKTKIELFKPVTDLTKAQRLYFGAGAGAITDAVAFQPYDPNLADLFVQFPATKFAVTEWLQTNPNGDPGMERLKNTLAGLVPGWALPEITRGVAKGFKVVTKPVRTKLTKEGKKIEAAEKKTFEKKVAEKGAKTESEIAEIENYISKTRTTTDRVILAWHKGLWKKKLIINHLDFVRGLKYFEDAAKGVKGIKTSKLYKEELGVYKEGRFLAAIGGMIEHFLVGKTFKFKDGVFEATGKDGLHRLLEKNLGKG